MQEATLGAIPALHGEIIFWKSLSIYSSMQPTSNSCNSYKGTCCNKRNDKTRNCLHHTLLDLNGKPQLSRG